MSHRVKFADKIAHQSTDENEKENEKENGDEDENILAGIVKATSILGNGTSISTGDTGGTSTSPSTITSSSTQGSTRRLSKSLANHRYVSFGLRMNLNNVEIDEGVQEVGNDAFKSCANLNEVSFPSTLRSIDEGAFQMCEQLRQLDLSNTRLTDIGRLSFKECSELDVVRMPPTLESIGFESFKRCRNLTQVDLSNTKIKHIEEETFSMCDKLGRVYFPATLETIGHRAFSECQNLHTISFPDSSKLESIGIEAFCNCGIHTLIVPPSVKIIEEEAFKNCPKLSSIVISKFTKVHQTAFSGCTLLPHFMLSNVSWVKDNNTSTSASCWGFAKANLLETLVVKEDVEERKYKRNETIRHVKILEGVKHIQLSAFKGCISVKSVELPDSLSFLGASVFKGCTSLQSIDFPENVTCLSPELLSGCISLKEVTLSSRAKYIYDSAFENCSSLEKVELPKTVVDIHDAVFKNCSSLKEVIIPENVSSFYSSVFEGCASLKKVVFQTETRIDSINDRTFYQCSSLKECVLPPSVSSIGQESFFECKSLTVLNIHEGVTEIGECAFSGCTLIEYICIPHSVSKIGARAFRSCKSLRSVTLLNPKTKIGKKAFAYCDALETVKGLSHVDNDIKSYISEKVFFGCESLETPLNNEIHIAAEGKCWPGYYYPLDSHKWIKHKIDDLNKKLQLISDKEDDATFITDYNGHTAFQCAVRGGAPDEYLIILAQGRDKTGRTHFDRFSEKYASIQADELTDDKLAFCIAENSKLIAATPIGEGERYLESFGKLLGSSIFDPRTVPEFIEKLNRKFENRRFAFILMLDIIIPIVRAISYSVLTYHWLDYIIFVVIRENDEEKYESNISLSVWYLMVYMVYVTLIYLMFREYLQLKHGATAYITDVWNWSDIFVMFNTFVSTVIMHKWYLEFLENFWKNSFLSKYFHEYLLIITFFVWMNAVLKLKVVSIQFATFVSGFMNIIWTLMPFIVVTLLILSTFAIMFLINDLDRFSGFGEAFCHTFSEFLAFGGVNDDEHEENMGRDDKVIVREMVITGVFGMLVVVLLLNVVIAVVSTAWESVTERGRDEFLLYRIKLFLEVQDILNWMKPQRNKSKKHSFDLTPDRNYYRMWKDSKTFVEVIRRTSWEKEGLVLVGRILLNGLYIVMGLFSFGMTLPRPIIRNIFTIDNSEAISVKRNHLQNLLKEVQQEVDKLEKLDRHIRENPKDQYLILAECKGIPSHFELKRRIRIMKKRVQKCSKDVKNFKHWKENIGFKSKQKFKAA